MTTPKCLVLVVPANTVAAGAMKTSSIADIPNPFT